MADLLRLVFKTFVFAVPLLGKLLQQRIAAIRHSWTYKAIPTAKNVVILGGSFAGVALARRLNESLPTGFKVILIEKNSHFNFLFNFPRFSVLQGHEHTAFVPYTNIAQGAPQGIFTRLQDEVVGLTKTHVLLASGDKIDYCCLAIATGSSQPLPAKVSAKERREACRELRSVQERIKDKSSHNIAIIGAGAVGVELASDIKDFYPDKSITLIHGHEQLLNQFGKRLHDYVMSALKELGVRVLLNERPQPVAGGGSVATDQTLVFSDGHEELFDLVISCTGQRPNSGILADIYPDAISKDTSRIAVKPTLQIETSQDPSPRIFALGDVAEHGGPRMARANFFQAMVAAENIVAMTQNRPPSKTYTPKFFVEGAIKLTLGKTHNVLYCIEENGRELLVPSHSGKIDLDIAKGWSMFGANLKDAVAVDYV